MKLAQTAIPFIAIHLLGEYQICERQIGLITVKYPYCLASYFDAVSALIFCVFNEVEAHGGVLNKKIGLIGY